MTREEEIINSANEYVTKTHSPSINEFQTAMNIAVLKAYIVAAKWADEHPNSNGKELLYVAQKTAERTKKEIINKVCNWLEDTDSDMEYWNSEEGFCKSEFINDLRKVMEE